MLNNVLQLLCEKRESNSDVEQPVQLWKHHHQKGEGCKSFSNLQVLMVAVALQV